MPKARPILITITAAATLIVLATLEAQAQSASQRRAELAEISDLIAGEPDPIMRIVNLEEIVAEGDFLKTELAIRSAMGIDDPQLHAVAARAYLMSAKDVTFEWILPDPIASKLAADEQLSSMENNYYKIYLNKGGRIPVRFSGFENDGSFQVDAYGQILEEGTGRTVGDRLVFRAKMRTAGVAFCNFEVRPTPDLELEGVVSCEDRLMGSPTRIVAPMY